MKHPDVSTRIRLAPALAAIAICCILAAPALASTKFTGGSPAISATIDGINEYQPGQDATIHVLIKNTGTNSFKQLDQGTIDPEDLPTTAKQMTAGLSSGTKDIIIKTDPQMIGELPGNGKTVAVTFTAKITENATSGEYILPLTVKYIYLRPIVQETGDVFQFTYNNGEDTIPLTVRIKPQVKIDVLNMTSDPLATGSEGYITMTLQNIGPEQGKMAVAKICRNGNSPVIPTDNSVYIGDFPSGGTAQCRFKVSVAKGAMNKTYPLDVAVAYTNREGAVVTSQSTTLGIPVNDKAPFDVISTTPVVSPGSEKTIEVRYRNNGTTTVYNAQARLTGHPPLAIADNTAYLGDLRPGGSAVAQYSVQADSTAESGDFVFDSKVRYRDALANSQESDTIPVTIRINPSDPNGSGSFPTTLVLVIGIIVIIGAGVVLWNRQRLQKLR